MGNFDKGRSGGKSFGGKPSFGGDRGGSRGGRPSFGGDRGGRPSFGGRNDRPTEMFKAVCDSCHKSCEVPFAPSNGKPIYCNDCFSKNREFDNRPSFGSRDRDNRGGSSFSPRNDRNDRRDSKPAFQSAPPAHLELDGMKKQIEALTVKLDTVIRSIEKISAVSGVSKTTSTVIPVKAVSAFKKVMAVMPEKSTKKVVLKKAPVKKVATKSTISPVAKKVVKKVAKVNKK